MQFMIYTQDIEGGLPIRKATRDAHLKWLKSDSAVTVQVAGPWLDDEGVMRGSLMIGTCEDRETLDAWISRDPYGHAGLPSKVVVHDFILAINNL